MHILAMILYFLVLIYLCCIFSATKIGTKSVLYGAHCFWLHGWFVAAAWAKLYGKRSLLDPRLWVAFFVHDLGYLGKPNMDGDEGEEHPELGAKIMHLFDMRIKVICNFQGQTLNLGLDIDHSRTKWQDFTMYHSRFLAKRDGRQYSQLCVADKLAICLTPAWLYLPMVNATGEIKEYMKDSQANGNTTFGFMKLDVSSQRLWHSSMCVYLRDWVAEHRDLKPDTWTKHKNRAVRKDGVWE